MLDVINLAEELRLSIETGNQIHACLALQWNETKDETPLEKRFGRRQGIDYRSGGSPLTIETGSDFPIGINDHLFIGNNLGDARIVFEGSDWLFEGTENRLPGWR